MRPVTGIGDVSEVAVVSEAGISANKAFSKVTRPVLLQLLRHISHTIVCSLRSLLRGDMAALVSLNLRSGSSLMASVA